MFLNNRADLCDSILDFPISKILIMLMSQISREELSTAIARRIQCFNE